MNRAMCPLGGAVGIAILVCASVILVHTIGMALCLFQIGLVLSMIA